MRKPIAGDGQNDGTGAAVVHSNPISQAGFTMIPNVVVLDERLSLGAKMTYGYLKHLAWSTKSDSVESALVTLCRDLAISENTARAYLRELSDLGLVETKRRGLGLPNLYVVHEPECEIEPQELRHGDADTADQETRDLRIPPSTGQEVRPNTGARAQNLQAVTSTWKAHAPPLIEHRESYLADAKTRAAVERALRTYPVEAVVAAVENYATVLAGAEFRWDYRWTIVDFLKRGLDRFVPEADPLRNFRIKQSGEKFGRRDVSSRELLDAADRIAADRQTDERRSLEPG